MVEVSDKWRDYKTDGSGVPIPGGSRITNVINTSINNSSWTPVKVPAGIYGKNVIISERAQGTWKLSEKSDGSTYLTVTGPISGEMAVEPGQTLFYAQHSSGSGTIEVLLVD